MPQHIIVEHTQATRLHLIALAIFRRNISSPIQIFQQVIATLDARVVHCPERTKRIIFIAFIIEEHVPVLHIRFSGTAYPEIITHDFSINVQGIVLVQSPVGPMNRIISSNQSLLNMRIRSIIIFQWFTCGIIHFKETVTTTGSQHRGDRK